MSHPSRVRGLKSDPTTAGLGDSEVAPFAGAWIEIDGEGAYGSGNYVAPFTGAWIEIKLTDVLILLAMSHPSRVRGLKYCKFLRFCFIYRRTLRRCVD